VYADANHHFCFRYPPSYKPVAKHEGSCRQPKLRDEKTRANIYICVDRNKFELSSLAALAPTGIESPPEPVEIGSRTFYYYGPGGGGVQYPDRYYFNLRGNTLSIDFDGPYENDKTPTERAKEMERKVLASFYQF
jgi:hypothetical protein